ncbi:MAG: nitroreductase family deazaflavin-dependent oxidoreductase [Halieaceae bacterium]|jgi:deazaflavin-dependent oxidoreductase (nitroreductase family)|uniref:nitroreductase family deazaflavin-dependent oxidoreductase n=1 Tax=Haliea alexandrii TaxID=2448162 RepID=UPI0018EE9EFD|nr:nitroreductase family deazaflavin-dependent oxidoreductase [Haliea alexandrii]MCR9185266.1 nitroreductase family deazaflavin-dependent oxidoreductase [Halieaceae bacterium]
MQTMKVSPIQRFIRWFGGSESGRLFDVFCVRWFSFSPIIWVFTKDDKSGYNNPCILTTVGRKSGLTRSTVLPVFPTGDGKLLVVGSRGGTSRDPHWAHNLRARPEAGIRYKRKNYDIKTRLLEGTERDEKFALCCQYAPVYTRYQQWANQYPRILPVFEIEDVAGSEF